MKKGKNITKTSPFVVILIVTVTFLINFIGKFIAVQAKLPIWLDSIGTCIVAYFYGPVCGAIVGAGVNISYGLIDQISIIYAISGAAIGLVCGFLAKKGYFESIYKMSLMSGALTAVSILISTPLNLIFYSGYCSNIWGDGVFDMFMEMGIPRWISSFLGEFSVDFVDKILTVLIVYCFINLGKKVAHKFLKTPEILSVLLITTILLLNSQEVFADELGESCIDEGFYTGTMYNDRNGLPGGEANDIAFTNDGYVWIGTYSGLYRYDGMNFVPKETDFIKSVNCIYRDEEGRMWIGTNDSGLVVMVDGKSINVVDEKEGLCSNAVSRIDDVNGYYYIGTKGNMNIIQISGGMDVIATIDEIDYTNSIATREDGIVVVVSNSGQAHVLKETDYLYDFKSEEENKSFTSAAFYNDELWLGTYGNCILRYHVTEDKVEYLGELSTEKLNNIRSLTEDEGGNLFVCSDSGVGYFDKSMKFQMINTGTFSTAIDNMGVDYQGNIWFTSSRQGVLKMSRSAFHNIYVRGLYETDVVNTITKWNGKYYIGSDNGIDVMNESYEMDTNNPLVDELEGQRIRNLYVDSNNHLWICVTAGNGLYEVSPDGSYKVYNESNGTTCNRFRSVMEMNNHIIAVAEDSGIDFIKNGKVYDSITKDDGLIAPMILTLYQDDNDVLYAGTDGGGIAIIKDGKIVDRVDRSQGLSSDVILRIIEDKDGIFIVTSNGVNYRREDGKVTHIKQFPYSNNFDMYQSDDGKLWILSSVGVYVVDRDEMLSGDKFDYYLLDYKCGLQGSITANSWSYKTDEGLLYIPCDNGCYMIDMHKYMLNHVPYRMSIDYALADEKQVEISDSRMIHVLRDSRTLKLHIAIPNYTPSEILVGYQLMGYDTKETIVNTKEIGEIKYTNLPSGDYKLVLNLYGENENNLLESASYIVSKEMRIYDYTGFKIYIIIIYGCFIAWVTWICLNKIITRERMKREKLEKEANMANETIMAIAKTVDAKDPRTSKHSERVAGYAACIAKALGWDEEACTGIYKTGLLHDIGKIGIPDAVLNKPGKLTDEEYDLMKTHVDRGAEILKGFTIVKDVDLGARFHHERYDGNGYPQGLKGKEIPLQARIIGIADAFDAMTSNRVYRDKLKREVVLEELKRCSGSQFDPDLIEVFLKLIEDGVIEF